MALVPIIRPIAIDGRAYAIGAPLSAEHAAIARRDPALLRLCVEHDGPEPAHAPERQRDEHNDEREIHAPRHATDAERDERDDAVDGDARPWESESASIHAPASPAQTKE